MPQLMPVRPDVAQRVRLLPDRIPDRPDVGRSEHAMALVIALVTLALSVVSFVPMMLSGNGALSPRVDALVSEGTARSEVEGGDDLRPLALRNYRRRAVTADDARAALRRQPED